METEISYKEIYNKGDHIIIKLHCNDIFEGDVVDTGKNRLDLKNVRQHNNPNKPKSLLAFYRNEIDTIKKFKSKETEKPACENIEPDFDKLHLNESEYDRLKEMSREFIYLDKADSRYFQAINLLSKAETIGVAGLGMEKSREASLKLLAVCTWSQVYLFDFVSHKQRYFYPELKEIFEAEYTCKVIHEAGPLLDVLYRQYKVYVKNTFDTQIVDMIIKRKTTGSVPSTVNDISQSLTDYMNFPSSYFKNALETTNKKWSERPLSDRRKGYAAQLVTYLIPLRDQMQKILFGEVYEAIVKIHNCYYYMESFQFSKNWQERSIPKEIQNLIPNLFRNVSCANGDSPISPNTPNPSEAELKSYLTIPSETNLKNTTTSDLLK